MYVKKTTKKQQKKKHYRETTDIYIYIYILMIQDNTWPVEVGGHSNTTLGLGRLRQVDK